MSSICQQIRISIPASPKIWNYPSVFLPEKQRNAVMSQALGIAYSLNPLLQPSAFLGCWMCIVSRSENTPCVTRYTSLCFKTLLCLLPEAVGWNCGLLKKYLNTEEAKCQEMGPCSRSKAPFFSHHPCDTFPLQAICFLCPSWGFNCAFSPKHNPLHPSLSPCIYLFSLWKTLCHDLASAQPCGSWMAPKWRAPQLFFLSAWNVLVVAL